MSLKSALGSGHGITQSIQDYLKSIYELTRSESAASTTALAKRLAVSPASVTGMVQRMATAKHPLVSYHKHRGVRLTRAGRRAALEVIRHHRLIETWLVRSLGYPWDAVHPEAEVLEHAISEDFERRISAALGNPARDPHGEPIPTPDLVMPRDASIPLAYLRPAQRAVVCRVEAHEAGLLRHLQTVGIGIGAELLVLGFSQNDGVSQLQVKGQRSRLTLGPAVTSRIFVEAVGTATPSGRASKRSPEGHPVPAATRKRG